MKIASGSNDADEFTALVAFDLKHDSAVGGREQGVILAKTYVVAGMKMRAALTNDDVAGLDDFAAETLDAQSFRVRVATVSSTTTRFLMCHNTPLEKLCGNAGDSDFRVILAMAHLFHMVLTPSEFNDFDFFMAAL